MQNKELNLKLSKKIEKLGLEFCCFLFPELKEQKQEVSITSKFTNPSALFNDYISGYIKTEFFIDKYLINLMFEKKYGTDEYRLFITVVCDKDYFEYVFSEKEAKKTVYNDFNILAIEVGQRLKSDSMFKYVKRTEHKKTTSDTNFYFDLSYSFKLKKAKLELFDFMLKQLILKESDNLFPIKSEDFLNVLFKSLEPAYSNHSKSHKFFDLKKESIHRFIEGDTFNKEDFDTHYQLNYGT
tara:strand:+ start:3441 stop:4160 length:720 start_codon:yes stop_codon:yes gene_type:complete